MSSCLGSHKAAGQHLPSHILCRNPSHPELSPQGRPLGDGEGQAGPGPVCCWEPRLSEASRSPFAMLAMCPWGLYVVCVYVRAREPREVCKSDKRTRVEPSVGECEAV